MHRKSERNERRARIRRLWSSTSEPAVWHRYMHFRNFQQYTGSQEFSRHMSFATTLLSLSQSFSLKARGASTLFSTRPFFLFIRLRFNQGVPVVRISVRILFRWLRAIFLAGKRFSRFSSNSLSIDMFSRMYYIKIRDSWRFCKFSVRATFEQRKISV